VGWGVYKLWHGCFSWALLCTPIWGVTNQNKNLISATKKHDETIKNETFHRGKKSSFLWIICINKISLKHKVKFYSESSFIFHMYSLLFSFFCFWNGSSIVTKTKNNLAVMIMGYISTLCYLEGVPTPKLSEKNYLNKICFSFITPQQSVFWHM
jgi:hypothetical protein